MRKTIIWEMVQYFFFGIVSTALNCLVFVMLVEAGFHYVVSNMASYGVAVVLSYWLNEKFVFGGSRKRKVKKLIQYSMGRAMLLAADSLLLVFLVEIMGVSAGWAKLPVAAIFLSLNYLINKFWVFR